MSQITVREWFFLFFRDMFPSSGHILYSQNQTANSMKRIIVGIILITLGVTLFGQKKVTGVVTDRLSGETLPGVNVVVEGTSSGTTTDLDGRYSIEVAGDSAVLLFSFVGMETVREKVDGRSVIDVAMAPATEQLHEVMVVAYGVATKEAYTGAAEVVDKEVIENRPVTSFQKALQGTTAGLQVVSSSGQPGAGTTVRIRGIGSLSASSAPLYVLDGVPMSGSLSDLNPNDIESVTVLKDAAAASLYGSRAANGVIIVTTKQGKKGQTSISFTAQTGFSSRISGGYDLMNSTQFYEHSWQGLYNRAILDGQTIDVARAFAHTYVEAIVGFNPFALDDPLDDNGQVKPGTRVLTNTDWRDEVYKGGVIQDYNLNVSGGSENTKVYFSMAYYDDSGITLGSNFKRYSGKVNVSHKVNSFITAGMNNYFSYSVINAPPAGSGHANPVRSAEVINAATPVYNDDGTFNWKNTAVYDFNPVGLSKMDKYNYKTARALVNAFLDFQILKSLTFKTNGSFDYSGSDNLLFYNPDHGNGAGVNGRSNMTRATNKAWNISNLFNWRQQFNRSSFDVILGQEAHGEEYSPLTAGVTDFSIPGEYHLIWGAQPEMPGSYETKWNMISYLSQVKYSFDGKYYLTASLRADGSSRFGANNKYGLFYSVGGSWIITKESFMPATAWLNNLKLRASYGTSGNNNIGNYASLGLYGGGANYGGYPGITPVQLANDNLTWEKITTLNAGVEFFLLERLSGDLEYYNRKSDALLFSQPLSAAKGFGSIMSNLGAMVNSGFEVTLNYDAVKKEKISYSVGMNLSTNHNEILNLTTDKILSGTKILEVGGDVYQFYMREWAGVNPDNGMPMWFTNAQSDDDEENNDEPPSAYKDPHGSGRMVTSSYTDAERIRMGSALPKVYGGFNNLVRYGNFELSFYFYFSVGAKVYNQDYATNMHDGASPGYNLSTDALASWTPNNRYTDVPLYVINNNSYSNQLSSRFLEDASYLRLKNIMLSYNLPPAVTNRLRMKGMRVYVMAENIWTVTGYKGFDPEVAINGTTGSNIPGTKVVSVGLKLDL
jgi:TonB-linked SusC/RagA family outer membrane protein